MPCFGVISPGQWIESSSGGFEKLGIDMVLLPEGEKIPFARRRDLAIAEGTYNESSTSARANLRWEISENALNEANAHFDRLVGDPSRYRQDRGRKKGLLVIDELGQLELCKGQGLTSALDLLRSGQTSACCATAPWAHCLAIVREKLLSRAMEVFGDAWGDISVISPDECSKRLLFDKLL